MADFPSKRPFHPPERFRELRKKTLRQVSKDFSLQGFDICLPESEIPYEELVLTLAKEINSHKVLEGPSLERVLYQFDISEKYSTSEIITAQEDERAYLLADAILKRCFAKVMYREKYS